MIPYAKAGGNSESALVFYPIGILINRFISVQFLTVLTRLLSLIIFIEDLYYNSFIKSNHLLAKIKPLPCQSQKGLSKYHWYK